MRILYPCSQVTSASDKKATGWSSRSICPSEDQHAIVHAQDGAASLAGTAPASTGVYVGCVWQEYALYLEHARVAPSVAVLTGSGMNFMVGRVSYSFGLQGAAHAFMPFPPRLCRVGALRPFLSKAYWDCGVPACCR